MAAAMDFSNAKLPALTPLIASNDSDPVEAGLKKLFIGLFNTHAAPSLFDANVLANPQLGSIALVRKSIDSMGLSSINEIVNDNEARLLHKAWRGNHRQGRGFFMFEAMLRILYHHSYSIEQYWHPAATSAFYPAGIFLASATPDTSAAFLTSRIYINIPSSEAQDLPLLSKLALSLLPARIVAFISATAPVTTTIDANDPDADSTTLDAVSEHPEHLFELVE